MEPLSGLSIPRKFVICTPVQNTVPNSLYRLFQDFKELRTGTMQGWGVVLCHGSVASIEPRLQAKYV